VKLQKDLREFIELLNSHEVEYLIVGGHAVAFHGYPRLTVDIGCFVRPSTANARRLTAVLQAFGFGTVVDEQAFTSPDKIIQLGRPPNRIDLLTGISGISFDEAWENRVSAQLDGVPVAFIGRETLLRNKRASGRAKDLADIAEIERRK
jgi:uncharacterized nucleotidyltransferase DUF6036